ncbi:MAG: hypothetical protein Q7T16_03750 [Candidatus Burarchaeum sp.]|nr:hypothetical protein [Candidatus Burarchaeum sp.]MDO8339746.1 hypothetical protein [Candidatus Burarchaeum sp.]
MRSRMRGQASFEMLVILAMMLVVLIVVIGVTKQGTADVGNSRDALDARRAVDDIAKAADSVYFQGAGARRQIYMKLPSAYDAGGSNITNDTIVLRVGDSDYAATSKAQLHGQLPTVPGGHWIWIISEGNSVKIGNAYLYLGNSGVYVTMAQNSTAGAAVSMSNVGNDSINITLVQYWAHSDVTLNLSDYAFSLSPSQETSVSLTFQSNGVAAGLYSGTIDVIADYPGGSETAYVSVTAEVVPPTPGPGGGGAKELTVTPHTWSVTLSAGNSTFKSFTVCTNNETTVATVTFTPTPGAPGAWVGNTAPIGPLDADSCDQKVLTLSVPGATSPGTYTGSIAVSGDGRYNDTISLSVIVSSGTDTQGPLLFSPSHMPNPAYNTSAITINATGDDSTTGGSKVTGCEIKIDSAAGWSAMGAVDGVFDAPTENIYYNAGNFSAGPHGAQMRCTDSKLNIGNVTVYNFTVYANDTQGPLVLNASHTPNPAYKNSAITINATGDDSTTGGSNVTGCEIKVDAAVSWAAMSAVDGTFNSVTEKISYNVGTLTAGPHGAQMRCADSKLNIGNVTVYNFTVYSRKMAFVRLGAVLTARESGWQNWINTHGSGAGYNWSYDTVQWSNVLAGTVNLSNYTIVIFAEYALGAGMAAKLSAYATGGGAVVFLARAAGNGPRDVGLAGGASNNNNNRVNVTTNAHYITSPFATGQLRIYTSNLRQNYPTTYTGTVLANLWNVATRPSLGDASANYIHWGIDVPLSMNANGDTISQRTIDYALASSAIG